MGDDPIRYETILSDLRRDIVMGKYPVGTYIKSVIDISKEFNIGVATSYKIHEILEREGFVSHVARKGAIVIPFDREYWQEKIHEEAEEKLKSALNICKHTQMPKEQVASIIQGIYCKQPPPVRNY